MYAMLAKFEEKLLPTLENGDLVTFTGRVPSGISMDAVKAFLEKIMDKGARVVIDSRSFEKDDLVQMKPWLIKPNEEEIAVYLDREINSFEDVIDGARELRKSGIENVMISLGSKGALLVCEDGAYVARPPKIEALSTIGAGDSSIGGFLAAALEGNTYGEMLRRAVSYGSAACLSAGTRPPVAEDVARIYDKVSIEKI